MIRLWITQRRFETCASSVGLELRQGNICFICRLHREDLRFVLYLPITQGRYVLHLWITQGRFEICASSVVKTGENVQMCFICGLHREDLRLVLHG